MNRLLVTGFLLLGAVSQGLAVWPPSTALADDFQPSFCGIAVVTLFIGIGIGVLIQRSRHERE